MLAIESPVFEKMLLGEFREAQNPSEGISLPDDDPKAMRHFRMLAYCSHRDRMARMKVLTLEETLNLVQFCHKYMALSITKLCTDRLLSLCDSAKNKDLIKMFDVTRLFRDSPLNEAVVEVSVI